MNPMAVVKHILYYLAVLFFLTYSFKQLHEDLGFYEYMLAPSPP